MIKNKQEFLDAQLKLAKLKAKAENYKDTHKMEFWTPFKHQQKALDFLKEGKKIILMQGSNRIGKTVLGACVVGSACLGKQMWDGQPSVFGEKPVRCRIVCVKWETHAKEVIVPALYEWLPEGSYEIPKKNNLGVEYLWTFKNGSTIELITHAQDTRSHEGWKGHIVWSDEPLPRDKYLANLRGLIDYNGVFLLTMTALYEPWIMDDIALRNDKHIGVVQGIPMKANTLLDEDRIQEYAKDCIDEAQREARINGGWMQTVGKVWRNFDMSTHIVEPFDIPMDWPVTAMVDFHLNLPQAISFYAWDKLDREWVIDEVWESMSVEKIIDTISKRKVKNKWRLEHCFVDPLIKGVSNYKADNIETTYATLENGLRPYGITVTTALKDKASGIRNIESRLKGMNNIPSIYFFRHCNRHIWEIPRWVYDIKGMPRDEDDHFCENLYRSTLAGIKYTDPDTYSNTIIYKNKGIGVI